MVTRAELQRRTRQVQLRARTRMELLRRQQQQKRIAVQRRQYKEKVESTIERIKIGKISSEQQIPLDVRGAITLPKDYFSKVQSYKEWEKNMIKNKYDIATSVYFHRKQGWKDVSIRDFPVEVQSAYRTIVKNYENVGNVPLTLAIMQMGKEPKVPPGFYSRELMDLRETFAQPIRIANPRLTEFQVSGMLDKNLLFQQQVRTLLSSPKQLEMQRSFAEIRGYKTANGDFGTLIPVRPITEPIIQAGGVTLKIEEAEKRGIVPTSKERKQGAVFIPFAELKTEPWYPEFMREQAYQKEQREYEEKATYKELWEKGDIPALIRKAYREGGYRGLRAVNLAIAKITGETPMTKEEMKRWGGFLGEIGLFVFFSPVFVTGAAYSKQAKTIQKQITKTRFEKLSKEFARLEKNVATKKTLSEQLKYLKTIKSQLRTNTELKNFDRFLQHLVDKQILKAYAIPPAKELPIIFTPAPKIPTPALVSAVAVGKVSWFGALGIKTEEQRNLEKQQDKLKQLERQLTKQKVSVKQATTLKVRQKEQQKLNELQKQLVRQRQKYRSAQLSAQRQISKQRQLQKQKQIQRTKQVPKYLTMQTSVLKAIPKVKPKVKPKIPLPLFGFPEVAIRKKIAKLPLEKKQQLYDVLIKRRKKFIKVFDDLPYNKAKKKGSIFTDFNLGATFKLIPDKISKKPIKDIKAFTPNPKIFRDYRISKGQKIPLKNMWIEKREARLNTKSEVSQLLKAKRLAPKKKVKRRKKK